eukprot:6199056-Pleurochrysis_carterae.AAC.3
MRVIGERLQRGCQPCRKSTGDTSFAPPPISLSAPSHRVVSGACAHLAIPLRRLLVGQLARLVEKSHLACSRDARAWWAWSCSKLATAWKNAAVLREKSPKTICASRGERSSEWQRT